MSAEAPRRTGIAASTPKEPQGCLPGFLRRLFGQTQATYQLPSELENFAARLNHRVTNVTNELNTARSQAELEKVRLEQQEAKRIAEEKETEGQKRDEFTRGRLQSLEEIREIAEGLGIKARLAHINATVWEGKGIIRNITTPPESATELFLPDSQDGNLSSLVAGYELVYSYKSGGREETRSSDSFRYRYAATTESTYLRVAVGYADPDGTSINGLWPHVGRSGKFIDVSSEYLKSRYIRKGSSYGAVFEAEWLPVVGLNPLDRDGIEDELEQLLISESTERIRAGAIPSKLYLDGQEKLREAKKEPQWNKWKVVITYHPECD